MKFVSAITALVATMAAGSEAARPTNKHEWKRELTSRMQKGQFDKKTLLRNAKPHNDAAKARELGNDDAIYVTSSHSIQFVSCFSLNTSYEELFEEGGEESYAMMNMFSQGNLLAMKSYAIFRLCYGTCDSSGNGDMEYVVDLNTYLQALVNYLPDQMEEYCEACKENSDSCAAMLYSQYGGAYQQNQGYQQQQNAGNNYNGANVNNVNYNYGGRKLSELQNFETRVLKEGQVVKQLDCNLCQQYNCLDDDDANNGEQYGFEAASEWLNEISECKDLEINYNPYQGYYGGNNQQGDQNKLYAGFLCNGDGSGVEIGLFADEECSLYMINEPFSNYMTYYDTNYAEMTKEVVEFTFSNAVFSCKKEEYVYTTQNLNGYNGYNGNYNWNQNEQEVAEWCNGLFEADYPATDMGTCGAGYGNDYFYANSYYQSFNDDDDANAMYKSQYDWYSYDITAENSLDTAAVCAYAHTSGGLHTFYNKNNGNMYSYTNDMSASSDISEFLEDTDSSVSFVSHKFWSAGKKMSAGGKAFIVILVGLIAGAGVALFHRYKTSLDDDKNVGLIDSEVAQTGEVA